MLPGVDEFVLAVGRSDDDTRARAEAIAARHPSVRLLDTEWDTTVGSVVLSIETDRAMAACRGRWGIYIQADEVLADGGAERLRRMITTADGDPRVEALLVDYIHFYGGFERIGESRRWYRREVRAMRLGAGIRSHGDAQGFRVGAEARRVRARRSGVAMYHYGWARPAWALQAKRRLDHEIYETERRKDPERPLLPWQPGLRRFRGEHPIPVREWIAARRGGEQYLGARTFHRDHLRVWLTMGIERLTGWRPFEYRNYTVVG